MRSTRIPVALSLAALIIPSAYAAPRPSPHDQLRLHQPALSTRPIPATLQTPNAPAPSLIHTFITIFSRSSSR